MPPVPQENRAPVIVPHFPVLRLTRNPSEGGWLKVLTGTSVMESWTLSGLGFVAGACTTFSLCPQVLKAWRSADREAISKRTYLIASSAYALWIVHGVMIGSVP